MWYVFDNDAEIGMGGGDRYVVARDESEARRIADEKYGVSSVIIQVGNRLACRAKQRPRPRFPARWSVSLVDLRWHR